MIEQYIRDGERYAPGIKQDMQNLASAFESVMDKAADEKKNRKVYYLQTKDPLFQLGNAVEAIKGKLMKANRSWLEFIFIIIVATFVAIPIISILLSLGVTYLIRMFRLRSLIDLETFFDPHEPLVVTLMREKLVRRVPYFSKSAEKTTDFNPFSWFRRFLLYMYPALKANYYVYLITRAKKYNSDDNRPVSIATIKENSNDNIYTITLDARSSRFAAEFGKNNIEFKYNKSEGNLTAPFPSTSPETTTVMEELKKLCIN